MNYRVIVKRKVLKRIRQLPVNVQKKVKLLVDDLKERGPVAYNWPKYSKLSAMEYLCHLSRKWVACWRMKEETIEIEVYYAGSRENAPY